MHHVRNESLSFRHRITRTVSPYKVRTFNLQLIWMHVTQVAVELDYCSIISRAQCLIASTYRFIVLLLPDYFRLRFALFTCAIRLADQIANWTIRFPHNNIRTERSASSQTQSRLSSLSYVITLLWRTYILKFTYTYLPFYLLTLSKRHGYYYHNNNIMIHACGRFETQYVLLFYFLAGTENRK